MLVSERFEIDPKIYNSVPEKYPINFGFDGFGEIVYYRTYSRKEGVRGCQENWLDTVVRWVQGTMSVRKDWYKKIGIKWDENYWNHISHEMIIYGYQMKFLAGGRGMFAMGSDKVYEIGSMALNNCGATGIHNDSLPDDMGWAMDACMLGVGVGFRDYTTDEGLRACLKLPNSVSQMIDISDDREGWVASVVSLISSYYTGQSVDFRYHLIRAKGQPIKGMGGSPASGPGVLKDLHNRIRKFLNDFINGEVNSVRLCADIANAIGYCVVSGNVRRSAEILIGSPNDNTFLNLKNFEKYPERKPIGFMSNNTVVLETSDDFLQIPMISERIRINGEPGIANMLNIQKYGKYLQESPDPATMFNPCAEIPLEDKELCNLAAVYPTRCNNIQEFYKALELATIYATTVSLLQTQYESTNAVIGRNRRIGVSLSGLSGLMDKIGAARTIRQLRDGYKIVRSTAIRMNQEACVPVPIRVTTIQPEGTKSQLAGVEPGMHWLKYRRFIRRIIISKDQSINHLLQDAKIPFEECGTDDTAWVYEYPVKGDVRRVDEEISAWEQMSTLAMCQREWSDNMVSCTVSFDPETEGPQVEFMIGQFAPLVKTLSMMPRDVGIYEQMPYEYIDESEYIKRKKAIQTINWTQFEGDGFEERFCTTEVCETPSPTG